MKVLNYEKEDKALNTQLILMVYDFMFFTVYKKEMSYLKN